MARSKQSSRSTCGKIVEKTESDDELEENPTYNRVLKVFQQFDINGDGVIDRQEFEKCLAALGLAKACLHTFLQNIDKDGDCEIQYGEFVKWALAPAGKATPKSRLNVYWPEQRDVDKSAVRVDADADEPGRDSELTLEDVERILKEPPEHWPEHGLTVLNNMHKRFPEYPVEGIIFMMRRQDFVGGKVMAAIRATGAKEVDIVPPSAVKVGSPGAFPADYLVRSEAEPMPVYREGDKNWGFYNMRDRKCTPCGELLPGTLFKVLEVKRGNEYGFCFGRIEYKSGEKCWVVLGLEVNRTHWTAADQQRSTSVDLDFTDAERVRR
eukprot:SRR837773.4702.p1 GENE.SRR837773.4702~~SRR837773.4702.p1  ORF type:complete len:324 (+),score=61.37 SRR837773.4702:80-1051(+)